MKGIPFSVHVWFLSVWAFAMVGCVKKSDHVRIVNGLKAKLLKTQQQSDDFQAKWNATKSKLSQSQAKGKRLKGLKQKLEKQIAELSEARANCLDSVKALAAKRGQLGARLRSAIEQIERLRKLAQRRKAFMDRLRASFQSMVNAGKLSVKMRDGMFIVQLAENILFDSGRAYVKKAGRQAISEVANLLKSANRRWQVTGHTDTRGNEKFNWSLSTRRALAVLMVMLKAGMPASQISAAGFGQFQPVAANDTRDNRALNRRTEIVLVPNLQTLKLAQNPSPFWICQHPAVLAQR